MEYMTSLDRLALPHWLIIAGGAFVLFGTVGIIVQRARK
jgi:hypothetical protein